MHDITSILLKVVLNLNQPLYSVSTKNASSKYNGVVFKILGKDH